METTTINYVPAEMASFKYILEAAIAANLNIRTEMENHSIEVEIPEDNNFNERMELGLRNESVNYTSTVVTPKEDERDNIITEITKKNAELERSVGYHRDEEDKYRKYWLKEADRNAKVKERIEALKVMMDSIFNPIS